MFQSGVTVLWKKLLLKTLKLWFAFGEQDVLKNLSSKNKISDFIIIVFIVKFGEKRY